MLTTYSPFHLPSYFVLLQFNLIFTSSMLSSIMTRQECASEKLMMNNAKNLLSPKLAGPVVYLLQTIPSAGMSVAYQDCKSKLVIDLDGFGKMCDEINSWEKNEAEQGRLTSNARAIKVIFLSLLQYSANLVNHKMVILMNCCVIYVGERG